MAISVRSGGTWKPVNGAHVRSGGVWKPIRYLFVADGVYLTNPPPDPPPIGWEPIYATRWKLARAFEPPYAAPATPTLSPVPEHMGQDPPPRIDARVDFQSREGEGIVPRSWELEIWVKRTGSYPRDWWRIASIDDPDATTYTEVWMEEPGFLTARLRYVNEAGPGPWSGESNQIFVQPSGG